jgi:hypothetical protein
LTRLAVDDDQTIHEAACRAGATVMGSEDAPHHYIMTAAELRAFIRALGSVPVAAPCPVPLPLPAK